MNCLIDYIGLKFCNSPEPLSGLYVNQLPGMTLESIDKTSEKDNLNFKGVWKDVQARAWIRLNKDVRSQLRTRYNLKSVKNSVNLATDITSDTIAATAKYRGVVIDLGHESSFHSIAINSFSIKLVESEASIIIKFFDQDGFEIDSFEKQTAPAGVNVFPVGKKYLTSKIFIAVNATSVALFKMPIITVNDCDCHNWDCLVNVYGAESEITQVVDIDKVEDGAGIHVDFGVVCDYGSIICRNKTEFQDAWLYLLGSELMIERLLSTRLNRFTTIDKESAAEQRDYYLSEYERFLAETIASIRISEGCCVECAPLISRREVLP